MKFLCDVSSREFLFWYGFVQELAQRFPALVRIVFEETSRRRGPSDHSSVFLVDLFGVPPHIPSEAVPVGLRPAALDLADRQSGTLTIHGRMMVGHDLLSFSVQSEDEPADPSGRRRFHAVE